MESSCFHGDESCSLMLLSEAGLAWQQYCWQLSYITIETLDMSMYKSPVTSKQFKTLKWQLHLSLVSLWKARNLDPYLLMFYLTIVLKLSRIVFSCGWIAFWVPGAGCTKQLKIKWDFRQPFSVFRGIFFRLIKDTSTEGALTDIGNTDSARKSFRTKETVVENPT